MTTTAPRMQTVAPPSRWTHPVIRAEYSGAMAYKQAGRLTIPAGMTKAERDAYTRGYYRAQGYAGGS